MSALKYKEPRISIIDEKDEIKSVKDFLCKNLDHYEKKYGRGKYVVYISEIDLFSLEILGQHSPSTEDYIKSDIYCKLSKKNEGIFEDTL